jgi:hypothetical protein
MLIIKTLLPLISVNPNISNETLNTIIKDKFEIKPQPIQLWRARTKAK